MLDALLGVGKTLNAYSLLFEIRAKGGAIDWKSCFAIGTEVAFERKDRFSVVETAAVRELTGSLTRSEGLRFALVVMDLGCFRICELLRLWRGLMRL
ncbi:hypothetical protein Patl1_27030 [Pistacia atlantica]|uniref:Uncharacterized protein n=1 Tax=Pistacia atlantica TaxID=434234 RepID=A0ACC1AZI2_9ROSI|nr:hypothetical protein Patl1_27030 [Pistacia atlantica]